MTRLAHTTLLLLALALLAACSSTSHLPEGETLYTGISRISYGEIEKPTNADTAGVIKTIGTAVANIGQMITPGKATTTTSASIAQPTTDGDAKAQKAAAKLQAKRDAEALATAKTEVEAILAFPPNGSLFGSSTMRSPFTPGLWLYNSLANDSSGMATWFKKYFGSKPVLLSAANADVRTRVSANTLHNYGYFRGTVSHDTIPHKRNPRKAKLAYNISMGHLYRLETISYEGFPTAQSDLIKSNLGASLLIPGEGFSAYKLSTEQSRIETLFRENGYYYYKQGYSTYQADTVRHPGYVQLRMTPIATTPPDAQKPWYVGTTTIFILRDGTDRPTDSLTHERSGYTYKYSGSKIPLSPMLWYRSIVARRGQKYRLSYDKLSLEKLNNLGLFSSIDMQYQRRDTLGSDTIDLRVFALLDKVYDASFEMNARLKTNHQVGPGAAFSLVRRNAFGGGETVTFKLSGSYEWQYGSGTSSSATPNSYELGTSLSFEFPRFLLPWIGRKVRRYPSSTVFSLSANWINRSGYYSMINLGADATYKWHKKTTARHEFTLFSLEYYKLLTQTAVFDSIMGQNPALYISMRDQFVPSMSYTYTGTSRTGARHTRSWQLTIKQAGNITSALYALSGQKMSETGKTILGTPYSQFVKATTEFRENFRLTPSLRLATRIFVGAVYAYGNSTSAPYSEQFYVGGANSIRAFSPRTVGPGSYKSEVSKYSYISQVGDFKIELNAELRFPIAGSLAGAIFLDAGNVWLLRGDDYRTGGTFTLSSLKDAAVGTGTGLRYDMGFIVLRLDLGIGLHTPYTTTRTGWYNMENFRKSLMLNFAIGYPF